MAKKEIRGWDRLHGFLRALPGWPVLTKRRWAIAGCALLTVLVLAVAGRTLWTSSGSAQNAQQRTRVVPVEVATAEKKTVPVRLEALGTVTPMATVAIKARVESVITAVHFDDGARVKQGDLLFTLDSRQIEAEMKRVQAVIDGAEAQLEQADRDVKRYTELVAKNATTQVTLNNAQTQVNISRATAESNKATLENLKVQLDFTSIRAPIAGRMSAANVKIGNFVRPSDTAPLATIIQLAPVYVTFTVPQASLPNVRRALSAETATVETIVPGEVLRPGGQVTMIENTVDPATGMVTIRATMPNRDEILWPGTLVTTQLTLREEQAVIVPSTAVQVSQSGKFVFVVKNGTANVQPVKVERILDEYSVISEGLQGGETVVTDGQLLLSNGTRVNPRGPKTGS
ncbi:MAG: efflux RND transporter periplasmic adaptor subunit [Rhizobiales bacterium]|nr:efflux RND transporter periplasmic adaptor subunit [Hyphomicrobiales bacterium]